jgi:hypothetical protein
MGSAGAHGYTNGAEYYWDGRNGGYGGDGGAAIQFYSKGTIHIDGKVTVRGTRGLGVYHHNWRAAGGGAGGSILINTTRISGTGEIDADGGSGGIQSYSTYNNYWHGGGGGGGRIAIICGLDASDALYSGSVHSFGGDMRTDRYYMYTQDGINKNKGLHKNQAGAGTIYKNCGLDYDSLIIDNNNQAQANTTQISQPNQNISIKNVHILARAQLSFLPVGLGNGTKNIIDIGTLHQDGTGFIHLRRDDILVLRSNTSESGLYETIVETVKVSDTTLSVSSSSVQYIGPETSIRTNFLIDEGASLSASHNLIVSGINLELHGKIIGPRNVFVVNSSIVNMTSNSGTSRKAGIFQGDIFRIEDGSHVYLENMTSFEISNLTIGPPNKPNLATLHVSGNTEIKTKILKLGISGQIDGVGGGWGSGAGSCSVCGYSSGS